MAAKHSLNQRTHKMPGSENQVSATPDLTKKNQNRSTLHDDNPERLRQATEDASEVEDEKVIGEDSFGTPSPGPARSPGSEH